MTHCGRLPHSDLSGVHRRVRLLRILCVAALILTAAFAAIATS